MSQPTFITSIELLRRLHETDRIIHEVGIESTDDSAITKYCNGGFNYNKPNFDGFTIDTIDLPILMSILQKYIQDGVDLKIIVLIFRRFEKIRLELKPYWIKAGMLALKHPDRTNENIRRILEEQWKHIINKYIYTASIVIKEVSNRDKQLEAFNINIPFNNVTQARTKEVRRERKKEMRLVRASEKESNSNIMSQVNTIKQLNTVVYLAEQYLQEHSETLDQHIDSNVNQQPIPQPIPSIKTKIQDMCEEYVATDIERNTERDIKDDTGNSVEDYIAIDPDIQKLLNDIESSYDNPVTNSVRNTKQINRPNTGFMHTRVPFVLQLNTSKKNSGRKLTSITNEDKLRNNRLSFGKSRFPRSECSKHSQYSQNEEVQMPI